MNFLQYCTGMLGLGTTISFSQAVKTWWCYYLEKYIYLPLTIPVLVKINGVRISDIGKGINSSQKS